MAQAWLPQGLVAPLAMARTLTRMFLSICVGLVFPAVVEAYVGPRMYPISIDLGNVVQARFLHLCGYFKKPYLAQLGVIHVAIRDCLNERMQI